MKTLDDLTDQVIGLPGMPARIKFDRDVRRSMAWSRFVWKLTLPLSVAPRAGEVARVFWHALLTEGLRSTVGRFGALSFVFLNDGEHPTLWHVFDTMRRMQVGQVAEGYPGGAPRSAEERAEWTTQMACGCQLHWATHANSWDGIRHAHPELHLSDTPPPVRF